MSSRVRWVVAGAVALAVTAVTGLLDLDRRVGLGEPPALRFLARSEQPFTRPFTDDERVKAWRRLLPGRNVRLEETTEQADAEILVDARDDEMDAIYWALAQQGDLGVWLPARGTDVARQWHQRAESGALADRRIRTATSTWRDPRSGENVLDHHLVTDEPWNLMDAAVELDRELPVPAGLAVVVDDTISPSRTVFVHEPPVFFNEDIVETRLLPTTGTAPRLEVRLTAAAAARLAETTAAHQGDELAVQLLGEIGLRLPIDPPFTGDRWTLTLEGRDLSSEQARVLLRAVRPGAPLPRTIFKRAGSHPGSRAWRWPLAALLGLVGGMVAFAMVHRLTRASRLSAADRAAAPFA